MMERHNVPPIRSGALTLLLALAAICLAVLAVLSLTTAQADLSLAQKSLDRFSQDAALENEGQPGLLAVPSPGLGQPELRRFISFAFFSPFSHKPRQKGR